MPLRYSPAIGSDGHRAMSRGARDMSTIRHSNVAVLNAPCFSSASRCSLCRPGIPSMTGNALTALSGAWGAHSTGSPPWVEVPTRFPSIDPATPVRFPRKHVLPKPDSLNSYRHGAKRCCQAPGGGVL
jgi:hypothetical protein